MTHWLRTLLLATTLLVSNQSYAQNMQVVGNNSLARECYRASTAAALSGSASRADVETCTNAVHYGQLRRADLIATYVNRGVINTAIEDFKAAAKDYNRAIDMNPDVAEAYVNRGNLWFMANHLKEAILDYDKALELGFGQPFVALLNRGMVKEQLGQLEAARADYVAALDKREGWEIALEKLDRVEAKLAKKATTQSTDE